MPNAKVDGKSVNKKGTTKILTSSPYKNEFVTPEERVEAKRAGNRRKQPSSVG